MPPTTSTLAETTDRLAAGCGLTGWGGQGDPTRCRWCGGWMGSGSKALFCSVQHQHEFWVNHSWKKAKEEAKRRAGRRCERCGAKGTATSQVHHRGGDTPGGRTKAASCDHHLDPGPDGAGGLLYLCFHCHQAEHYPVESPRS